MKLYYSKNLNPRVAVAAARHLDAPVEFVRAAPMHPNNIEGFRALNPNTRVPVLEADDGSTLWETDAIVCRLSQLTGSDFWREGAELPEMLRWINWSAYHLNQHGGYFYFYRVVGPIIGVAEPSAERSDEEMASLRQLLAILDDHLDGRHWLMGDHLSYADFRVGSVMPFAAKAGLPIPDYPNVQRLSDQLDTIEAWRDPFAGLPTRRQNQPA
jgi:glutathione S-transferase